jgi:hypothetical protein
MQKKIGKCYIYGGRNSGIGLGIHIDKHHASIDFLFWYAGWEF